MAYIGKSPTIGNFQKCDAITVVNGQAAYTLQVGGTNVVPESVNHMLVSLNGILQAPTDSFTVSGSTLTFASNLATGDVIDFVMILGNVLDLGVPSDNTVTAAKLNNDIISGQTALATAPDDTDEFLVSDAGTIKRIDYSLIKSDPTHVLLSTTTISANTASVSFGNTIITSTYKNYMVTFTNITLDAAQNILLKISSDNGSNYKSAAQHAYAVSGYDSSGNEERESDGGSSSGFFLLPNELTTATKRACSFTMYINDPFDNSKHFTYHTHGVSHDDASKTVTFTGAGEYTADETDQYNAIQFIPVSGNFDEGIIKVYGIN